MIHLVTSVSVSFRSISRVAAAMALREGAELVKLRRLPHLRDAEGGDVLIEAHKRATIVCPTDSELVLLRLQRRVREGVLPGDQVLAHAVAKDRRVWKLRLDAHGDFLDTWPEGVFDARFPEVYGSVLRWNDTYCCDGWGHGPTLERDMAESACSRGSVLI